MQPKAIQNIFNSLKACYDASEQNPVTSPMVVGLYERFLQNYKAMLEDEIFRIDFEPTAVRVNGMAIPNVVWMSESVQWLQEACGSRHVESLVFEEGATKKDLQKFIAMLFHPAKRFSDRDTASKMLFRQHVQTIAINPENLDATFSDLDGLSIPRQDGGYGFNQAPEIDPNIVPTHSFTQADEYDEAPDLPRAPTGAPAGFESFQRSHYDAGSSAPPAGFESFQRGGYDTPPPDRPEGFESFQRGRYDTGPVELPPDFESFERGGRGAMQPKSKGHGVHLFISREDRETLMQTMFRFIDQDRLKKVAESLTMMRRDMGSPEYEVRRLAFSSYHVVVLALIERDQLRPLSSILKSLDKDLHECKEIELYHVHLQSLIEILKWMRKKKQYVRLFFALDLLAREKMRKSTEIQAIVKKQLRKILDLSLMEDLMRLEFPEIKPYFKSLFVQHGLAVVDSCMQALFHSEDRSVRKKLLEILMRLGPMIYPLLLKELDNAIRRDSPWYIKRNLLTIMAKDPPVELLPFLDQLLEERNTRILDLVYRCLFLINDRSAVEKGKMLLKRASGGLRTKLFQYVRLSKEPAYARFIAGLYEGEENLKEKIDIINILATLDSADSIAFFDKILKKTRLFESKEEAKLRGEAAKALAASEHAAARTALTKYARDKNEVVRMMVEKITNNAS
ncbi:hypothetical protein [Acanthopleuribacter pedis]|uniref:HEAT repeat domain-containing protein n=1 Tax=Acanthopleuribacter pedis TaxID=442870 RepID=A0A8J7QIS5_9BACT|nr:hypothetical protein [Acanthopleuribacter pedis]MBO1318955.1 hypothetical protein [Acanthopleuribacter pedis]